MSENNHVKRVLWLVAARSGSVSVPHKNIRPLAGVPLMAYRIRSALKVASNPQDVWISTDSLDYAKIAQEHGAQLNFMRPPELATSTAKSSDVILHAMHFAAANTEKFDAICLLEPTSPFVYPEMLVAAVDRLFEDPDADAIVATRQVRPSTFYVQSGKDYLDEIADRIHRIGFLRRQDEKPEVTPSGGFYISKWERFLETKSFYTPKTLSFLVPDVNGLEIDEPLDWEWAEFLLNRQHIDPKKILGFDPITKR